MELEAGEPNTPIKGDVPKADSDEAGCTAGDGDRLDRCKLLLLLVIRQGSMAFLDVRSRALIAGDAFQVRGGVAVSGVVKFWFPFPAMATWSKEVRLESTRRLRQLEPSLLAVGHGRMIEQPLPLWIAYRRSNQ